MNQQKTENQIPRSVADSLETEEARLALEKAKRGQKLNRTETAAIRRLEKRQDENRRWAIYNAVPKKHYRAMSGRSAQTLQDQARRHEMPIGGAVINLPEVIRFFHDFLATHTYLIRDGDRAMDGDGEEQRRYRAAKAGQEEIKLAAMQGRYCETERILNALGIYFASLRESFRSLQKKFGPSSCAGIQDTITSAEKQTTDFLLAEMAKTGSLPPGVKPPKPKPKRKRKPRAAPKKTAARKTTRKAKKK